MGRVKHGATVGGRIAPEYRVWYAMKDRCANPKAASYQLYGGRGINVCTGWRDSFAAFARDMGDRPSADHSIDRIDNDRGYDCGHCDDCVARGAAANCRWATRAEQGRNKRTTRMISACGETMCLTDWAAKAGMTPQQLHDRLVAGWSENDAVSTPIQRKPKSASVVSLTLAGVTKSLSEWSAETGINKQTLYRRLENGWGVERTLTEPVHTDKRQRGRVFARTG